MKQGLDEGRSCPYCKSDNICARYHGLCSVYFICSECGSHFICLDENIPIEPLRKEE